MRKKAQEQVLEHQILASMCKQYNNTIKQVCVLNAEVVAVVEMHNSDSIDERCTLSSVFELSVLASIPGLLLRFLSEICLNPNPEGISGGS